MANGAIACSILFAASAFLHVTAEETCYDMVQNGLETDIDCGGPSCWARCERGGRCERDSDCSSSVCSNGQCSSAERVSYSARALTASGSDSNMPTSCPCIKWMKGVTDLDTLTQNKNMSITKKCDNGKRDAASNGCCEWSMPKCNEDSTSEDCKCDLTENYGCSVPEGEELMYNCKRKGNQTHCKCFTQQEYDELLSAIGSLLLTILLSIIIPICCACACFYYCCCWEDGPDLCSRSAGKPTGNSVVPQAAVQPVVYQQQGQMQMQPQPVVYQQGQMQMQMQPQPVVYQQGQMQMQMQPQPVVYQQGQMQPQPVVY